VYRIATIALLLASAASPVAANELSQRGKALVTAMCARCHAIGTEGRSPHLAAPPFRELGRRYDLDTFGERLREGILAGHPDMPPVRFTREDARAVVAYLRSIQAP
jgi:mono/diheme cytochrome c family protein